MSLSLMAGAVDGRHDSERALGRSNAPKSRRQVTLAGRCYSIHEPSFTYTVTQPQHFFCSSTLRLGTLVDMYFNKLARPFSFLSLLSLLLMHLQHPGD